MSLADAEPCPWGVLRRENAVQNHPLLTQAATGRGSSIGIDRTAPISPDSPYLPGLELGSTPRTAGWIQAQKPVPRRDQRRLARNTASALAPTPSEREESPGTRNPREFNPTAPVRPRECGICRVNAKGRPCQSLGMRRTDVATRRGGVTDRPISPSSPVGPSGRDGRHGPRAVGELA